MNRNAILSSTDLSWGGYALILAILLLLLRLLLPNLFWRAVTPALLGGDYLAARSHAFLSSFENATALEQQVQNLEAQNASLSQENADFAAKISSMTALTDSSSKGSSPELLSGVVARPPQSPYDTLVIARGSHEGVAAGMETFGPSGVPIGVVSVAWGDFSRVTLFTSPGVRVNGWVGRANLPVTLLGGGAGTLLASAPRAANLTEGDSVSVPGPGQLLIGKVVRIDSDPSSPSVTLRIQSSVNPFSIAWVTLRDVGASLQSAFTHATSTLP